MKIYKIIISISMIVLLALILYLEFKPVPEKEIIHMYFNMEQFVSKLKFDRSSLMCNRKSYWKYIDCVVITKDGKPITFSCTKNMCAMNGIN